MDLDARALKASGLAATSRRLLVMRCLSHGPPRSAKEIYESLRAGGSSVGLTTVYRTLTRLSQAGLVHAFDRSGETVYKRCGREHHFHVICRDCGHVAEVDGPVLAMPDLGRFHIEAVYGLCWSCAVGDHGR
jgi:Fur family transcriptional regulator, ferric uptake regulator